MVRRASRWVLRAVLVLVALLAVLGWPRSMGGRASYSIVSGHSMNPTYHTGDLVVLVPERTYHVGQIVVYRIPAGEPASGQFVVHRIVGGSNVTGFITKGDNNPSIDIWTPHNIDIQGRAVLLVPQAGWVLRQGRDPLLYAVLGGLYCGRLLWPSRKDKPAGVDLRKAPKHQAEDDPAKGTVAADAASAPAIAETLAAQFVSTSRS
jgi:signal peptidase